MRSSFKATLVLTTALAIALTSLDLRPAAATPESGPVIVKQNAGAAEFSAARKRRRGRGVNPAIPLAAFGAIIGTIGSIAAAQQRRDHYERYYDGPYHGGYAYRGPYEPPARAYRHYGYQPAPVYRHHGYHRHPGHVEPGYGYRGAPPPPAPTDRVPP
jgi:hypothetical protein